MTRDELIEKLEDSPWVKYNKHKGSYLNTIFNIALLTLQADKDGYVLVPSEATDEMCSAKYYATGLPWVKIAKIIQARPPTELDDLLGGLK